MRITLTQTGGWANIPMQCVIDTETLPGDQAAALEAIVRAGAIFRSGPHIAPTPDGLHYVLTVETPDGARTATFDEFGPPRGADQMLRVLRPLCRPTPSWPG